jgi:two-component system NtrC family sensor kinase
MKLVHKLTVAFLVGILAVHGISAVITLSRERQQLYEDIQRDEKVLGRSIARTVARIWRAFGEAEALSMIDEANERHTNELRWIWLDAPAGDRYAASVSADRITAIARGELVLAHDEDAIYTYVPADIPGARIGAVEIIDRLEEEESYLQGTVLFVIGTAAALVLCCSVLAWALGTALVGRPVKVLLAYASTVERGDLSQRIIPRSRDELGALTTAMSKMCEGLELARDRADAESRRRLDAIEQLRHADRLATVGTLAAGVAHELGTPINVIEGHAQLIREQCGAQETIVHNAAIITKQCKRMTAIISDLLRFARRVPPTGSSVDVGLIAKETIAMCEVLARKRGVKITVDDRGDNVAQIAADPMQQVLTNVVMNGIQAMPDGGTLTVRLSREQVAPPNHPELGDYVCVRIADTGVGMDDATQHRIFEPFFTTKDVGDGTGLGLSVALGIAKDHHGWIDVASELSRGSIVTIYIPSTTSESA